MFILPFFVAVVVPLFFKKLFKFSPINRSGDANEIKVTLCLTDSKSKSEEIERLSFVPLRAAFESCTDSNAVTPNSTMAERIRSGED